MALTSCSAAAMTEGVSKPVGCSAARTEDLAEPGADLAFSLSQETLGRQSAPDRFTLHNYMPVAPQTAPPPLRAAINQACRHLSGVVTISSQC